MLMRMKSTTGEKFSVDVYVQEVVLKKTGTALEKDSSISLAIERGNRFVHSSEKEPKMTSNGDSIIGFNENLSLDATLFPDAKGKFQEKVGKLLVRKKKKGLMSTHVNVGVITLPLHNLVHEDQPYEKTYLLENCSFPGSQIHIAIAMRSLDDNTSTHRKSDAMLSSQHSTNSSPTPSISTAPLTHQEPPARPTSTISQNHSGSNLDSHIIDKNSDPFATPSEFERNRGLTQTSEAGKSDIFNSAVEFGSTGDFDPFAESFTAETNEQVGATDTWAENTFNNDWPSPSPTPQQVQSPASSPQKQPLSADHQHTNNVAPSIIPPPLPQTLPPSSPVANPHPVKGVDHHDDGVASPNHNDIEFVKQVVVVQEQKLQQAAQYVSFQEQQIATLNQEIEALNMKLSKAGSGEASSVDIEKMKQMESVILIQEGKLHNAEDFVKFQEGEINRLTHEITQLTSTVESLEAKSRSHNTDNSTAVGADEESSLKVKLEEAAEYISYQEERLAELEAQVEELQHQVSEAGSTAAVLPAASSHNEEQAEMLAKAREYIDYQAAELDEIKAENDQLKEQISVLQSKVEGSSNNAQHVIEAAIKSYEDKIAKLMEENKSLEEKMVQAKEYIDFQSEQHTTSTEEIAELTSKVEALEQKLASAESITQPSSSVNQEEYEQKIQQAAEYIQYQEEELANKEAELERLNAEVASLSSKIADLEALHKQDVESAKKAQVEQQPEDNNNHQINADSFTVEKKELLDKIAEMEQKLQQAADYIQFQDEQSASKDEELEELRKASNEERKKLEKLQHDLEMQINGLQHDLSTQQSQSAQQSEDNRSENEIKIADMEQKMKQAADYIKFQDEQLAGKDEDIQELRDEWEAEKSALEQQLTSLKEVHETFKSSQAKEYAELADKLKEVEEKLQQAADYITYQTEEIGTLQHQQQEMEAKYTAESALLHSQVKEINALLQDKDVKLTAAEARLISIEAEFAEEKKTSAEKLQQAADYIQYQEEQNTTKDEQIETLEESMETLRQELKTAQSGVETNTSKVQEMETKLQQAAEYINYQKEQLAEMEEKLVTSESEKKTEIAAIKAVQAEQVKQMDDYISKKEDENVELLMQLREMQESTTSKDEKKDLENKLDQAKEYIQYQEAQLATQQEEIEQLTARVEAANRAMSQTQAQNQAANETAINGLKVEIQKYKEEVQKLKDELRKQQEIANSSSLASSQLAESASKLDQASEYIEYQTSLINDLESEVKSIKQEYETKLATYQEQLAAVTEELENLHESTEKKDKSINQLKSEVERLKASNKPTNSVPSAIFPQTTSSTSSEFDEEAYAAQLKQSQEEIKMYQQLAAGIADKLLSLLPEKVRTKVSTQMRRSSSVKDSGQQITSLIDSISAYLLETSRQSSMADSEKEKVKKLEEDQKLFASRMAELEQKFREKDQECDKIVKDLITTKMDLANALNDKDTERKKAIDLRKHLRSVQQQY